MMRVFIFILVGLQSLSASERTGKVSQKGKSLRTVAGFTDGYLNLNYYYGATCSDATKYSQSGIALGSCVKSTGTVTYNAAAAGQTASNIQYAYNSYKLQLQTGANAVIKPATNLNPGSDFTSVDCLATTLATATPASTNYGIAIYYYNDDQCDPQYQIVKSATEDFYTTYASVFDLLQTPTDFLKSTSGSTTLKQLFIGKTAGQCVSYISAATAVNPQTINTPEQFFSITCDAFPSGTTATTQTNAKVSNVLLPNFQSLNFVDIPGTPAISYGSCNVAYLASYSYITYPACTLQYKFDGNSYATVTAQAAGTAGNPTLTVTTPTLQYLAYNATGAGTRTVQDGNVGYNFANLQDCLNYGKGTTTNTGTLNPVDNFAKCSVISQGSTPAATPYSSISLFKSERSSSISIADSWVTVKWYPYSGTNIFPSVPAATALRGPDFQYAIFLGYCYMTNTGSYKLQLGKGVTTQGYEVVTIVYNDLSCQSPSKFASFSSFNAILPFGTNANTLATVPNTVYAAPSGGGFYKVSFSYSINDTRNSSIQQVVYQDSIYDRVITKPLIDQPPIDQRTATCTKPLYVLKYQANKCIDVNTLPYGVMKDKYYPFTIFNGLLSTATPSTKALYINTTGINPVLTSTANFLFYSSYQACLADSGVSPPQITKCSLTDTTGTCTKNTVPVTALQGRCLYKYPSFTTTTPVDNYPKLQPPAFVGQVFTTESNNYGLSYIPAKPATTPGSNGWLNIMEYYNEGCTGAPIQQYSQYLGNCFKEATCNPDPFATVTNNVNVFTACSYKYQLDETNCASGNILKISYSDQNCTLDGLVSSISISNAPNNLKSPLTKGSLKCTRNNLPKKTVLGDTSTASIYVKMTCTKSSVPSTAPPPVYVPRPFYSYNYYTQTYSSQKSNIAVCANPYTSLIIIPNYCLADIVTYKSADTAIGDAVTTGAVLTTPPVPTTFSDSLNTPVAGTTTKATFTGSASYYTVVEGKLLRYSYDSLLACYKDSFPKCSAVNTLATYTSPGPNSVSLVAGGVVTKAYTGVVSTANGVDTSVTGTGAGAICTGSIDVTPTSTCFSDQTIVNNQMFVYNAPYSSNDDHINGGAIAGIVIGVIVFLCFIIVLIVVLWKVCLSGGTSETKGGGDMEFQQNNPKYGTHTAVPPNDTIDQNQTIGHSIEAPEQK